MQFTVLVTWILDIKDILSCLQKIQPARLFGIVLQGYSTTSSKLFINLKAALFGLS